MISANRLHLSLGGKPILRDVSLNLAPGEVRALCGPNGAGKSTLLSCLAGEHSDCAADVRYFGKPIATMSPDKLAHHRVVLEQTPSLAADFTVSELIELGAPLALRPVDLVRIKSRIVEGLEFADVMHRYVSELSGGQQHRGHFARVLLQLQANLHLGHRCFLFLDEPTASLDIGHQIAVLRRVRALAETGVGVLVVLHDLNLAAAFTDHVILLQDGQTVASGPPRQVFTSHTLSSVYMTDIVVETASTGQMVIQPVLQHATINSNTPLARDGARATAAL